MLKRKKPAELPEVDISEEDLKSVRPDYVKWQRRLFYMNLFIAIVVLILEIFVNIILIVQGTIEGGLVRQAILYFLLPSGLNLLAVLTDHILMKKFPKNNWLLNYTMVLTVAFMGTVVAVTHYVFSITLTIFMMPVLISVIFGNCRLCNVTAIMCTLGVLLAVIWRSIDGEEASKLYVIPEMVISLGMVLISYVVARILISMNEQQNNKLLRAIVKEKRAQEEAMAANRAKSTFLANMSHEIRTPINAILGMNEMILREEKDQQIRCYSENIRSAGTSLLSIISDVLDISKIESGRLEIVTNEYELSSLVSDCCNMMAVRARKKRLELLVECDSNLPKKLCGDETHIRQVVVNLLTNAVKYTEKGSVTLKVTGRRSGEEFLLSFAVRDTGIGISEEDQAKMFEQFQRFDMKRNRNIEGTGLGLAIVKKLTALMNGSVTVTSTPGEGSEFTFELPQKVSDASPCGALNISYSDIDANDYSPSFEAPDAHILIVDDLPVNQMVIVNLLKETLIQTDTAGSGIECLEAASRKHYDLILMDHMMPEMDGVEAYRRLRADRNSPNCDTPVIMLTANALAGVREEYIGEGFADYISKPVRGDKLEAAVRKYLPQELIHAPSSDRKPAGSADNDEFAPLLQELPELNLPLALSYCSGSTELYLDVLRDYCGSGRYDEMQSAFSEKRFEDYRICAHSLKSTSKTVGLEGLSERARASELAIRRGCPEYAVLDHDDLMREYETALKAIRTFLERRENNA